MHTLDLIKTHVIPTFSGRRNIRVWDAGCAMGPEPYSLVIVFAENMGHFAFKNLHIDATDVDGSNLFGKIISDGIYPEEQVKRIPKDIFKKYFYPVNGSDHFKIGYYLRDKILYKRHDLLTLQPIGDGYSLVVCKNVLLHFQYSQRVEVIKMFHGVLVPGGFFATEQTQKIPEEIENLFKQVTNDGQLFRKLG